MINVTLILSALITLIAALITAFVVPYIKSRTTANQREELGQWVRIAVQAAEQIFGRGTGEAKKQYALGLLAKMGYTADLDALDAMIEAEVLRLAELVR